MAKLLVPASVLTLILLVSACSGGSQQTSTSSSPPSAPQPHQRVPPPHPAPAPQPLKTAATQKAINDLKVTAGGHAKILVNTTLSDLYGGWGKWVPKCTTLYDYPSDNRFWPDLGFSITAVFPKGTAPQLPVAMLEQLKKYHIDLSDVDVCFHAQTNNRDLGEVIDHQDGSTYTTRLNPHAWGDPDAPETFNGSRLNRDFLIGLFDVDDVNMQDEVRVGEMKEFNVHVHDSKTSPRNKRIKLANKVIGNTVKVTSQSFWSLVIDDKNTNGGKRALATLHWLIGYDDLYGSTTDYFLRTSLIDEKSGPKGVTPSGVPFTKMIYSSKVANWKDLYNFFKSNDKTKDQSFMKKLDALIY